MGLDVKLTAKQETLLSRITTPLRVETALAFIRNGYQNGTKAYLEACKKLKRKPAKVPDSSASEILAFPEVSAFIDSVKYQAAETVNIDAAWVLSQAVKVHQRCMQAEAVLDREGNPVLIEDASGNLVPAYTFEHSGANKSLEIIGKHISVKAFEGGTENQQGESLNISFNVNEAVKDIRVTRGEDGA